MIFVLVRLCGHILRKVDVNTTQQGRIKHSNKDEYLVHNVGSCTAALQRTAAELPSIHSSPALYQQSSGHGCQSNHA